MGAVGQQQLCTLASGKLLLLLLAILPRYACRLAYWSAQPGFRALVSGLNSALLNYRPQGNIVLVAVLDIRLHQLSAYPTIHYRWHRYIAKG